LLVLAVGLGAAALADTPRGPHVSRVLLISIDGMHALDLADYVQAKPRSTLAELSQHGVTYTQARTALPSNSWPGLLAMVTGGSPTSTGVIFENSYDHALSPPGSDCSKRGTEVRYDSSIDRDPTAIDGGGIDPAKLPRDPARACAPVYPHQFLRVNTIFEVVKEAGGRTAWSDKHPAYEFLNGPSGKGVDDLYAPEIRSATRTKNIGKIEEFDDMRVQALLREIGGKDHTGARQAGVPTLFGMNFQAISVAQKLPGNGYQDAAGTPSEGLMGALDHTDKSLGELVEALRSRGLLDSTLIIVSAKHGDTPIDPRAVQYADLDLIPKLIDDIQPGLLAHADQDGTLALIWLNDHARAGEVARALQGKRAEAKIQQVYAGESLLLRFNDPRTDSRMPDLIVQPQPGVIYTDAGFIAEHGGFTEDDFHVPLLVSLPSMHPRILKSPVQTAQIAPTILRALALDPEALEAVRQEMTAPLPGLSFPPACAGAGGRRKEGAPCEER
jgi:hypothetical protein